ncbi:MAG: sulfurtransferase tusA [Sneathiella sp.]|jgi:tRNA 2-thiouridine synthesizing protein A|uniref:sulfurtransferase TusA family protein n=1 Tax=Sneathiella sp. TaxID=1964365 RepID=UPI000C54072B|nr:sulfurtransferase TusA family protein [Sneathiella sp.]MAL78107.1 sulfurtransferase tusA [Sneathiella sp.]|tara:strand:+ start:195 stop:434 length:240 start_codon:yes stop_codon:yes gene_type:complete
MTDQLHFLDTSGLQCPLPVLRAKKTLRDLAPGARLRVIATDPASVIDFRHFCNVTGYLLEKASENDGKFEYIIIKNVTG